MAQLSWSRLETTTERSMLYETRKHAYVFMYSIMDHLMQNVFATFELQLLHTDQEIILKWLCIIYVEMQKVLHACADMYQFSRDDLVMLELIESGSETGQSWLNRRTRWFEVQECAV